jgi:hypothetical protein
MPTHSIMAASLPPVAHASSRFAVYPIARHSSTTLFWGRIVPRAKANESDGLAGDPIT